MNDTPGTGNGAEHLDPYVVPFDVAVGALELGAVTLRAVIEFGQRVGRPSTDAVEHLSIAAQVLDDLANNVRGGVSQLVRPDDSAVFIDTNAVHIDIAGLLLPGRD